MCVKLWFAFLCHIERIHTIVYSHNPFVFPLLFIHHSLYFSFHSALLFLIISLSCLLLSSSHAMYPLTFLIYSSFYIPSSPSPLTLILLFCLHLKLPLSLSLSSVLVSVEPLWLHRHTDSRMCCWGGLLFWDSPWR